jgi:PST family polysaccharide transporter
MRWGFFSAIFQLFVVVSGLPFGLVGVATAHAIAAFCLFVPALVYAGRPLGIGTKDVLYAVGPQTAAALIAVAIGIAVQGEFLSDLSRLARLVVAGLVCLTVYLAVVVSVFKVTAPLRFAFSLLHDITPMRFRRSS